MGGSDWIHIALVLHVMGAILGLGTNLTYGLITSAGDRAAGLRARPDPAARQAVGEPSVLGAACDRADPGLVAQASLFATSWLLLCLLLYIAVAVLGITVYATVLRRQVSLAERLVSHDGDEDDPTMMECPGGGAALSALGILANAMVVAILTLMVTQPALW